MNAVLGVDAVIDRRSPRPLSGDRAGAGCPAGRDVVVKRLPRRAAGLGRTRREHRFMDHLRERGISGARRRFAPSTSANHL
ncbi:hypothetical protein NS14008_38040 [Nocardia seriolae]|uniref:hypothetical protein n=1 Tax=Nocardia seriolae TaxID=37332 RepID=UPI0008FF5200|nr:hypothetical protein [Nocardia seriolae]OJF83855.1 hypothetical protein NS14008_38040 [Nocardia seriolae]